MSSNKGPKEEIIEMHESSRFDLPLAERLLKGTQMVLKYASLVTLTVQNAACSITMRMARTQQELFVASTAVVMAEVIKLVACLFMVGIDEGNIVQWYLALKKTVVMQPLDTLKVAVPSFVYTLQNNLIYIGATHLDAATCQVTYQLKILTTAIFAVVMLKKRLQLYQWLALLMLFIGVAFVQVAQITTTHAPIAGREQYPFIGFLAIVTACALSGFAGVYFEKILKGSEVSIWIRNVQLSVFAIPIGLCTMYIIDRETVDEKGFFYGYSVIVWFVIILQAIGGLVVAVVVKYADNILKGFATSLAIILSCIISVYAFDFHISGQFFIGACLVIGSIFLYSRPQKTQTISYKK